MLGRGKPALVEAICEVHFSAWYCTSLSKINRVIDCKAFLIGYWRLGRGVLSVNTVPLHAVTHSECSELLVYSPGLTT